MLQSPWCRVPQHGLMVKAHTPPSSYERVTCQYSYIQQCHPREESAFWSLLKCTSK